MTRTRLLSAWRAWDIACLDSRNAGLTQASTALEKEVQFTATELGTSGSTLRDKITLARRNGATLIEAVNQVLSPVDNLSLSPIPAGQDVESGNFPKEGGHDG